MSDKEIRDWADKHLKREDLDTNFSAAEVTEEATALFSKMFPDILEGIEGESKDEELKVFVHLVMGDAYAKVIRVFFSFGYLYGRIREQYPSL